MDHLEIRQGSGTQIKNEIYKRSMWLYVFFLIMGFGFIVRILILQYSPQGTILRTEAKGIRNVEHRVLKARRGDILSYDGKVLASTIPLYHVYMDFRSNGLDSVKFNTNVKPLALKLASFYKDKPAGVYLDSLKRWYRKGYRYKKISPRRINYIELRELLTFPLFKEGRYKGGWVLDTLENRVFPYGELAARSIGSINEAGRRIGVEGSQDSILSGKNGVGLYQKVSGTFWVPIEDEINCEPIDGLNVVTTLDVEVQDVAEKILRKQLEENEASWGTAILMDVKTGEIRALANLGRKKDGSYADIYNYAIGQNMEPGSTFKLVSLLA
ncbi:MAG: penicillin-binding transpeptidase domain-containing protein, partial [Rikenellaceae bacterium]